MHFLPPARCREYAENMKQTIQKYIRDHIRGLEQSVRPAPPPERSGPAQRSNAETAPQARSVVDSRHGEADGEELAATAGLGLLDGLGWAVAGLHEHWRRQLCEGSLGGRVPEIDAGSPREQFADGIARRRWRLGQRAH